MRPTVLAYLVITVLLIGLPAAASTPGRAVTIVSWTDGDTALRLAPPSWGAWAALELPPERAANLRPGHQLVVDNLELRGPPRAARRSAISP